MLSTPPESAISELRITVVLVRASDDDSALRGATSHHTATRLRGNVTRDAADRCFGLLLDTCFRLGRAVPVAEEEATVLDALLEFIVAVADVGALLERLERAVVKVALDILEQLLDMSGDAL